jgi:hypothetical protein
VQTLNTRSSSLDSGFYKFQPIKRLCSLPLPKTGYMYMKDEQFEAEVIVYPWIEHLASLFVKILAPPKIFVRRAMHIWRRLEQVIW